MSWFDLTGRRAVVTGGTAGIGLGIAQALVEHGAEVVLWGRSEARVEAARAALPAAKVEVVDVADEGAVVDGFARLVDTWGGVDVVVANAGIAVPPAAITDTTTETYRTVMSVNVDGVYWTVREGARTMRARGEEGVERGGSIVVVSSIAAHQAGGHHQMYAATKGAVISLAQGTAIDLARYGIRVNAVLPGYVRTDLSVDLGADRWFESHMRPRVPLRRWGTPEDIAGSVVYLASDASRFQTGSSMVVDGGFSVT